MMIAVVILGGFASVCAVIAWLVGRGLYEMKSKDGDRKDR
jgi:hypothetical protein